ncbi:MAG: hypothetical protein JWQ36_3278, partial [Enterovirga sp.]|nr:hypothetical protein [Enterovirga sp.]
RLMAWEQGGAGSGVVGRVPPRTLSRVGEGWGEGRTSQNEALTCQLP